MNQQSLINQYFEALDTDNGQLLADIITDDFVYYYGDATYRGKEDVLDFFEHDRNVDSDHHVDRILQGEDWAIAEGSAEVVTPEEEIASEMCDVFDFNEAGDKVTQIKIYSRTL